MNILEIGIEKGTQIGIERGLKKGTEQGLQQKLMEQVRKKLEKGLSVSEIADMLEENEEIIGKIIEEIKRLNHS